MFYQSLYIKQVSKVLKLELYLGLIFIIIVALITKNVNSILSGFLGFSIAFIATFSYVFVAFNNNVNNPLQVLKNTKLAFKVRLIVNIFLFVTVFYIYKKCQYLQFFLGYIFTVIAYWLSLIINENSLI